MAPEDQQDRLRDFPIDLIERCYFELNRLDFQKFHNLLVWNDIRSESLWPCNSYLRYHDRSEAFTLRMVGLCTHQLYCDRWRSCFMTYMELLRCAGRPVAAVYIPPTFFISLTLTRFWRKSITCEGESGNPCSPARHSTSICWLMSSSGSLPSQTQQWMNMVSLLRQSTKERSRFN